MDDSTSSDDTSFNGIPFTVQNKIDYNAVPESVTELRESLISDTPNHDSQILRDSEFLNLENLVKFIDENPRSNFKDGFKISHDSGLVPLSYSVEDKVLLIGIDYQTDEGLIRSLGDVANNLYEQIEQNSLFVDVKKSYLLLKKEEIETLSKMLDSHENRRSFLTFVQTGITADASSRQALFEIICSAINKGASDIHFEPLSSSESRVRFRLDGVLQDISYVPTHDDLNRMVNIIKVDANLKPQEKRLPQSGVIDYTNQTLTQLQDELKLPDELVNEYKALTDYRFRVSIAPLNHGEKGVLRILVKGGQQYDLEKLGFNNKCMQGINDAINCRDGIFLLTGPTGSGKTTTLYAALQRLNQLSNNIMTIEDPIETDLRGINQAQINLGAGRTFSVMLREYLRQDPDIILIGEMRDKETARIAVEASKTGHLVLSTLHTNDAISSLHRLYDLDIMTSDIQQALRGVAAQRLARALCTKCKSEYDGSEQLREFGLEINGKVKLYRPGQETTDEKCVVCNGIGYKDRVVIAEVWSIGSEERNLIGQGEKSLSTYRQLALKNGMRTLADAGMRLVLEGRTSISEVLRTAIDIEGIKERKTYISNLVRKAQEQYK